MKTGWLSRSKADESRAAGGGNLLVGPSSENLLDVSVASTTVVVMAAVVVAVVVVAVVVVSVTFGVGANL